MPMSARLHSVPSQPVEAEIPAAGGRGRCALPRVRAGERGFPTRRSAIHAVRRAQGEAVRAARLSRLRQERDRAGELPRHGQSGAGRCARKLRQQGEGVAFVGEEVTDAELKAMDRAGVRGVRFNFVKRLVDFTPRDVLERIAARIAPRLAHRGLFRDADLPELEGPFFTSLPTTVVVDHMGLPGREEGRRTSGELEALENSASTGSWPEHGAVLGQVEPARTADLARWPHRALRGDVVPVRAGARALVERSPSACFGAPTGRIPT